MNSSFDTEVTVSLIHGDLDDVPATFDYYPDWNFPEPDVGFRGSWEVGHPEMQTIWFGGAALDRSEAVRFLGEPEVYRIEECVADIIVEQLDDGDLEVAA